MTELIGVETRLEQLCEDNQTLRGQVAINYTDDGAYYLVVREKPHPDIPGAHVLSERYAYLTRGDGNDGWLTNGINRRVTGDLAEFSQQLAQLYAGVAARQRKEDGETEPFTADLTGE